MELKSQELRMNLEKLNRFKLINEKKVDLYIADLPNDHQENSGESPLLKKTYEELFYVEDPEDELDDIDHLDE